MAKKKKVAGTDIDWYLISIDRLKQIGLILVVVLLGLGGWWFYNREKGNPLVNAQSAIADARQALNTLAASKELNAHRSEFDRAQKKLDEAGLALNAGKYADAQGAAVESQTISRAALSGSADRENDAQFLTVEGDVQFQKSSTSDWKKADARTPLFNGDWVKTGDNASAELIFSNGSLYTISSNALLEIYAAMNPATNKKNNAVQMKVGAVEVATTDDASTVRTPGSQIVVDSESTTQVGVDKDSATAVVGMRGTASVTSTAGGDPVKLGSGEKVTATPQGSLSPVKKLAAAPALLSPADNQVFQVTPDSKVDFSWSPQAGATAYQLEVSRSRLFSTLEINSKRQKTAASARVTADGTFYWRVASVGPDGDVGPFSQFRRLRVAGGGSSTGNVAQTGGDTTPPVLTLKAPFNVGSQYFIIEGTTEPGATVFINEEEVDVDSSGHFKKLVSFDKVGRNAVIVKAVDAAGNATVQSQTVIVQE